MKEPLKAIIAWANRDGPLKPLLCSWYDTIVRNHTPVHDGGPVHDA